MSSLEEFDGARSEIQTPSATLSYVDIGSGPPALFVHGVGTNAGLWRNVIDEVSEARRCLAFDLPLHGRSPARDDQDFRLNALASLIDEFCTALDLPSVDLVAHDTGGALAQIFAAHHPERLRTMTLTNCDTHDNVPPEEFKPTVELARAGALAPNAPALFADLHAARSAVFATGYEDVEHLSLDTVRSFLEPILGTVQAARQFERMLSALEPTDLLAAEASLSRLTVPTLVVWGTGDTFFDVQWAYWLRDTIPGVTEVVEIDGAKLFFPDERASELAPHLLRHWRAAVLAPSGTTRER
jgi:pimeloyl-ACP methyl ester carboxylesterase